MLVSHCEEMQYCLWKKNEHVYKSSCIHGSQSTTTASRQVRFSHRHRYGGYNLILENKSLDALKDPEEDEEDTDILNPGKFDGFPEARTVSGWRQLRQKWWRKQTKAVYFRAKYLDAVQFVLMKKIKGNQDGEEQCKMHEKLTNSVAIQFT